MITMKAPRVMAWPGSNKGMIAAGVWSAAAPGSTDRGTYVRPTVTGTRLTPGSATLVFVLPRTIDPLFFVLLHFAVFCAARDGRAGDIFCP